MKIGILTHHYVNNFGAFLQTYALQQALKEMYPDDEVKVINAINIKHFIINAGGWFRFYRKRESLESWRQKIKLPKTFWKARKKYLDMTKRCYTTKAINTLGMDCIVIGSDEVWNYKESKGNSAVKFGVGLECKKIVAYAPSVGKSSASSDMPEYIKNGLESFSFISARDDLTEQFVEKVIGKKAIRVLDPTFLSNFPIEEVTQVKKPYILFYYCDGISGKLKKELVEQAHERGYAVYGAGEIDKQYTDLTINLTPFEWVNMFRNAEFVFTGTFHGAVFSILNQKQFQVFMKNESRIRKVSSLLKQFHINVNEIDLCNGAKPFDGKINYEIVDEYITELRSNSTEFLGNIKSADV